MRGRDVAKGIYFVNPIDRCLDRRVCRRYVVLDGRAQRTERVGEESVDLKEASEDRSFKNLPDALLG